MSEDVAHTIVENALARRRLESRRLLTIVIDNLTATASNRYDQVRVSAPDCPEWETRGWIIGTSQVAGETLNVVVTPNRVLYAGHLTVQHDAATENTVTVMPDEVGCRAVDAVLNWPEHIAQNVDRIIARNRQG